MYLFNKHQNFASIFFPDKISISMDLGYSFRIASVATQLGFWIVFGIIFGLLWSSLKPHGTSKITIT